LRYTAVNGKELFQEVLDCRLLINDRQQKGSEAEHPVRPQELLQFIISYGDDVSPNLRIALQTLLAVFCFDGVLRKII